MGSFQLSQDTVSLLNCSTSTNSLPSKVEKCSEKPPLLLWAWLLPAPSNLLRMSLPKGMVPMPMSTPIQAMVPLQPPMRNPQPHMEPLHPLMKSPLQDMAHPHQAMFMRKSPFPTFVSLATVRRKRHAEDEGDHQTDVIERVNEIYTAVVQSEECMEKIACEVGALAGDVGLTQSPALKLAGGFVPSKYKTYYKQFTAGKDCHKIKCGTFA